jgi:hypothetical protein
MFRVPPPAVRIAAGVLAFASACSPTSPYECVNGRDGYGRGPVPALTVSCRPNASDLSCTAIGTETGYCTGPSQDFTVIAVWASSNPAIAAFIRPGALKVFAAGEVEISATSRSIPAVPLAYAVAPETPPEQLLRMLIIVTDSATSTRLSDATVDVFPASRPPRSCTTAGGGGCFVWTYAGRNRIRVTKTGFIPAELTETLDPNRLPSVTVPLTPATTP